MVAVEFARATLRLIPMLKKLCFWSMGGALVLLGMPFVSGQDFNSAAAQLASKISERATPGIASLAVTNRSSINPSAVTAIRSELLHQLQERGWTLKRPEESETSIAITLSENSHDYVWTAEITRAGARNVVILESRRAEESAALQDRVTLSQTLLISSGTPLLDLALVEGNISDGAHLLALTPTSVELYQVQSSAWRLTQTQLLGLEALPNRDLRGRIVPDQGHGFDAFLPGLHCAGTVAATLSVSCRASDDPWPLSDDRRALAFYAANRNFFNGVLSGTNVQTGNVNPFYSAAVLSDRIIYSGIDGHPQMAMNGQRPTTITLQWGSDITAIQSTCQPDLVLASAMGDFNRNDAITAFRQTNSDFGAVSEPISFAGPVLDLKTTFDRQQALAISSSSGRYEAYLVTARCGH